MKKSAMRDKIFDEIEKIPDEKVSEILDLLHHYRLGLGAKVSTPDKILKLAGSWSDMPEDDFEEFLKDLKIRRKNAFTSRRNLETSLD